MGDAKAAALTTCQVASDGDGVRLVYVDEAGRQGSLALPTECLIRLIITLPRLAAAALQNQHDDRSLRIVYPIGGFRLEAAAGSQSAILTLSTPDGFEVAFALPPATIAQLQSALDVDAPRAVRLQ
jgi:hypothetical protein